MRLFALCLTIAAICPLPAQQAVPVPSRVESVSSSTELHRLFLEDQAGRQRTLSKEEAIVLVHNDAERRLTVKKLIDDGALHTAQDFEDAAFIFQHGMEADDYLLAHTLATIAVAKGNASARWIVTATLDRYLGKVGKAQIYGTQTHRTFSPTWTQEPYNRTLIPSSMLKTLRVDFPSRTTEQS